MAVSKGPVVLFTGVLWIEGHFFKAILDPSGSRALKLKMDGMAPVMTGHLVILTAL